MEYYDDERFLQDVEYNEAVEKCNKFYAIMLIDIVAHSAHFFYEHYERATYDYGDGFVLDRDKFYQECLFTLEPLVRYYDNNIHELFEHYEAGKTENFLDCDITVPPFEEENQELIKQEHLDLALRVLTPDKFPIWEQMEKENIKENNEWHKKHNEYRKKFTNHLKNYVTEILLENDHFPPRAYLELEYLAWRTYEMLNAEMFTTESVMELDYRDEVAKKQLVE